MRMKKFFYALGIGCMLSACSSNDELAPEDKGEIGGNANYLSIAIVTAGEDGTRADDPYDYGKSDYYDKGEGNEIAVKSLRLYFFDLAGNCVYQKNFDENALKDKITQTDDMGANPAVSTIATIEVELSANRDYHSVVAILNPATTSAGEVPNFKKISDLKSNTADYGNLAQVNGNFTMSNSVYYPTDKYDDAIPEGMSPVVEVPIYSDNIYTHVEIDKIEDPVKKADELRKLRNDKAVQIFVERVCSKVTVTNSHDFKAHFVDKEGKTNIIKVMGEDGTEEEIEVLVDFKGMALTNMAATSKVIKELPKLPTDGSSPYSFCQHVTGFYWNNPGNCRTHWEEAGHTQSTAYKRTKWNEVSEKNKLIQYINPNTQDATNHVSDDCDLSTKLIACAQLKFKVNGEEKALDLVKYSGGFWLPSKLINAAAVRVTENLALIDLSTVTVNGKVLTTNEQALAKAAIDNITVESLTEVPTGKTSAPIYLQKLEGDHDYLAELTLMSKDNYDLLTGLTGTDTEKNNVSKLLRDNINSTLSDMTNREIQYWRNGMTYFYVPIRHVGFPGLHGDLTGEDGKNITNYLNGVVRNHSYSIEIESVYGLGTPVIDPNEPIDPERPDDSPESYMTAKIHVLKWRLVSQKATLH